MWFFVVWPLAAGDWLIVVLVGLVGLAWVVGIGCLIMMLLACDRLVLFGLYCGFVFGCVDMLL